MPDSFGPDLKSFRAGLDALAVTADAAGLTAGDKVAGAYEFGESRLFTGTLQDGLSYQVSVRRADVGGEKTVLRVDATGWQGDEGNPASVRRVAEDLVIAPESGPDYALLTNNANCIFCHTTVTSMEAAYGGPGNRYEGTERVKVGGLNSLDTDRVEALESLVTGTVYTRGDSNLLGTGTTLRGIDFQTHRGRRDEPARCRGSRSRRHPADLRLRDCVQRALRRVLRALSYRRLPRRRAAGYLPLARRRHRR